MLTRAFLPGMVERGGGGILNVASTAAFQPLPYSTGYSGAKAYALTFSEALHQEVRSHGIAVTALCPGPVDTELWEGTEDQPIESAIRAAGLGLGGERCARRRQRPGGEPARRRSGPSGASLAPGRPLHPARDQAAGHRAVDAAPLMAAALVVACTRRLQCSIGSPSLVVSDDWSTSPSPGPWSCWWRSRCRWTTSIPACRIALVVAIACSLGGDVALMLPGREPGTPGPNLFALGLGSFLLAHLAYVAAFCLDGVSGGWLAAGAVAALASWSSWAGRSVRAVRASSEPALARPVAVYSAVIATMVLFAFGSGDGIAIAGAVLFATSDSLIARRALHRRRPMGTTGDHRHLPRGAGAAGARRSHSGHSAVPAPGARSACPPSPPHAGSAAGSFGVSTIGSSSDERRVRRGSIVLSAGRRLGTYA